MTNTIETTIANLRNTAAANKDAFVNANAVAESIAKAISDNLDVAKNVLEISNIVGFNSNNWIFRRINDVIFLRAWTESNNTIVFQSCSSDVNYELAIHYDACAIEVSFGEKVLDKAAPRFDELFRIRYYLYSNIYRESLNISYSELWRHGAVNAQRAVIRDAENFVLHIKSQLSSFLETFKSDVEDKFYEYGVELERNSNDA